MGARHRPLGGRYLHRIQPGPRGETDATGRVSFPGLLLGTYTVEVVANGFQNGRRAFIGVQAGRTTDTNLQLSAG